MVVTSAHECRLFPQGEVGRDEGLEEGREEGREEDEAGRGLSQVSSVTLVRGD